MEAAADAALYTALQAALATYDVAVSLYSLAVPIAARALAAMRPRTALPRAKVPARVMILGWRPTAVADVTAAAEAVAALGSAHLIVAVEEGHVLPAPIAAAASSGEEGEPLCVNLLCGSAPDALARAICGLARREPSRRTAAATLLADLAAGGLECSAPVDLLLVCRRDALVEARLAPVEVRNAPPLAIAFAEIAACTPVRRGRTGDGPIPRAQIVAAYGDYGRCKQNFGR